MTGTNLTQEKYLELGNCGSSKFLSEPEAILLINKEFGFEAGRIVILNEAEIDVTEKGSRYVKVEKAHRLPVYASTDWNYIRFNVRTASAIWYYEMINADLHQVII